MGHAGEPQHGQRAEPEDLRDDRGLAEPADRGRARLRVPGRDLAETELGRRGAERGGAGGHRRGRGRLPGDPGRCEGTKEDKESWRNFLRYLKERGLKGVKLVISDKCLGLVEALGEFYPEARWQRCMVHWYRNVFTVVPKGKAKEVAAMLKAIHAQEDRQAAREKAEDVAEKLEAMKLGQAAAIVREGVDETLSYMAFPREHWRRFARTMLERIMREIRRRTRVVGNFPDGQSALMLVAARLRHIAGTRWARNDTWTWNGLRNRRRKSRSWKKAIA